VVGHLDEGEAHSLLLLTMVTLAVWQYWAHATGLGLLDTAAEKCQPGEYGDSGRGIRWSVRSQLFGWRTLGDSDTWTAQKLHGAICKK